MHLPWVQALRVNALCANPKRDGPDGKAVRLRPRPQHPQPLPLPQHHPALLQTVRPVRAGNALCASLSRNSTHRIGLLVLRIRFQLPQSHLLKWEPVLRVNGLCASLGPSPLRRPLSLLLGLLPWRPREQHPRRKIGVQSIGVLAIGIEPIDRLAPQPIGIELVVLWIGLLAIDRVPIVPL